MSLARACAHTLTIKRRLVETVGWDDGTFDVLPAGRIAKFMPIDARSSTLDYRSNSSYFIDKMASILAPSTSLVKYDNPVLLSRTTDKKTSRVI